MRVLLIDVSSENGGAGRSFKELVITLKLYYPDIEPVVLCSHKKGHIDIFRKYGIEVYPTLHEAFNYSRDSSTFLYLIKLIPRFLRYIICDIYALSYVKKNIDMTTVDLIHTNSIRNDIGMILSYRYNIPHILHIREFGDKKYDYDVKYFRKKPLQYVEKHVTHYISITESVKKYWSCRNGIDKNKISVVYNGIDYSDIKVRNYKKTNSILNIVMTGTITECKGQLELIKAISILPPYVKDNVTVDFIGGGENIYFNIIKRKIVEYNLQNNIRFLGNRNNVHSLLSNYDIGVTCSRAEAFGRVTAEYMLAGLCVIASNTGGTPELVINNKTGLLYEYGDPHDLANKIFMLYSDQCKIIEYGKAGFNYAMNNFTTQMNVKGIVNVYRKTLEKSKL